MLTRIDRNATSADAFDDEFAAGSVDHLCRGIFEDEGNILDEFGSWEKARRVGHLDVGMGLEAGAVCLP